MKTQKQGGKYDYMRRAFASVDDMAYFIGRSPSYVQGRLTGGGVFSDRETELLNKAVKFYDRTDIEPTRFHKMQRKNGDPASSFVYSMVWTMISSGANMVDSVTLAQSVAKGLFLEVPSVDELVGQLYALTNF